VHAKRESVRFLIPSLSRPVNNSPSTSSFTSPAVSSRHVSSPPVTLADATSARALEVESTPKYNSRQSIGISLLTALGFSPRGIAMSYSTIRATVANPTAQGHADLIKAGPESHLTAAEFTRVFEVTRDEFHRLPLWRQIALRKKTKLYVKPTR
jgi:hypothetical protein